MQEFQLKGTKNYIRYHDFPGEGIPILFIHGLGCAGSFEYPQIAAQKELCGHRRILVDLLGSGFSDRPDNLGYTVRDHAEYLLEFILHLELKHFILYGHSLGGAIALTLADQCRDRIKNIILCEANLDGGGGFLSRSIAAYKYEDFISKGFSDTILANQEKANKMWAASYSISSPKAVYYLSKSAVDGQSPSWREILYSINIPRTFIIGEKFLHASANYANEMQNLASHGIHIEIVKNAGHFMAWENPNGLATAIKSGIMYD